MWTRFRVHYMYLQLSSEGPLYHDTKRRICLEARKWFCRRFQAARMQVSDPLLNRAQQCTFNKICMIAVGYSALHRTLPTHIRIPLFSSWNVNILRSTAGVRQLLSCNTTSSSSLYFQLTPSLFFKVVVSPMRVASHSWRAYAKRFQNKKGK